MQSQRLLLVFAEGILVVAIPVLPALEISITIKNSDTAIAFGVHERQEEVSARLICPIPPCLLDLERSFPCARFKHVELRDKGGLFLLRGTDCFRHKRITNLSCYITKLF